MDIKIQIFIGVCVFIFVIGWAAIVMMRHQVTDPIYHAIGDFNRRNHERDYYVLVKFIEQPNYGYIEFFSMDGNKVINGDKHYFESAKEKAMLMNMLDGGWYDK